MLDTMAFNIYTAGYRTTDVKECVCVCVYIEGLSRWLRGKESTCQGRRHGFNPWVRKIPQRRKWQPTPVFLPGTSLGEKKAWQATVHGVSKSRTQLSNYTTRNIYGDSQKVHSCFSVTLQKNLNKLGG